MNELQTFDNLIAKANQFKLYAKLVQQLNKDLALANIDLAFDDRILPTSLKLILFEKIYELLTKRFMDYLNLLYVVDVSEENIKKLDSNDMMQLSENVVFLILKREWQKVYYKNRDSFL